MKEAFEEFEGVLRVGYDVPKNEVTDEEMKNLFLIAFLSGQKHAIINPINPKVI